MSSGVTRQKTTTSFLILAIYSKDNGRIKASKILKFVKIV